MTMTNYEKEKRQDWNRRRLTDNARNSRLTKSQHIALYILSKYRHDAHCNAEKFYNDSTLEAVRFRNFINGPMNIMLRNVNLPELDLTQFIHMPDKDYARAMGLDGEYEELAKSTCLSQMEKLNKAIEGYLKSIDKKYCTWYAPSGGQRDIQVRERKTA